MEKMTDDELKEYRKNVLRNMYDSEILAMSLKQKRALLTKEENKEVKSRCTKNYFWAGVITFVLLLVTGVYLGVKYDISSGAVSAVMAVVVLDLYERDKKNRNFIYSAYLAAIRDSCAESSNPDSPVS